jgi:hypothetical protein
MATQPSQSKTDPFADITSDDIALASDQISSKSASDPFADITEEDIQIAQGERDRSLLDKGLNVLMAAGETYDRFISGPPRQFISELTKEGGKPFEESANVFLGNRKAEPFESAVRRVGITEEGPKSDLQKRIKEFDDTVGPKTLLQEQSQSIRKGVEKVTPSIPGLIGFLGDIFIDVPVVGPAIKLAGKTVKGAAKGTGKVVFAGTEMAERIISPKTNVVETTVDVLKGTSQRIGRKSKEILNPKRAGDYAERLRIAQKNGIDPAIFPETFEFDKDSTIGRLAKNAAQGGDQARMDKFLKSTEVIDDKIQSKIQSLYGVTEVDARAAGEAIEIGIDNKFKETMGKLGQTYATIADQIPDVRLQPYSVGQIRTFIKQLKPQLAAQARFGISSGTKGAQAKELLDVFSRIENSKFTFREMGAVLGNVGEAAFTGGGKSALLIPADQKKMMSLYKTISEEFIRSTGTRIGPELADDLVLSNKLMSDYLKRVAPLKDVLKRADDPAKVYNSLVKTGTPDQINALIEILPKKDFAKIKANFMKEALTQSGKTDQILYPTVINNLRRNRNTKLILGNDLNEFTELLELGREIDSPIIGAGSGASIQLGNIKSAVQNIVANEAVIEAMKTAARTGDSGSLVKQFDNLPTKQLKERIRVLTKITEKTEPIKAEEQILKKVLRERQIPRKNIKRVGQALKPLQIISTQDRATEERERRKKGLELIIKERDKK